MAQHTPLIVRLQRMVSDFGRTLSKIGAALVSPFEWLFDAFGRATMAISDRFERLDSVFLGLGMAILWPFRALWRGLSALVRVLLPESLRNVLLSPFRVIGRAGAALGKAVYRLAEALNIDSAIGWLVRKTRWLWAPFVALIAFFQAWVKTRNYKHLAWGLPVVIVVAPVLAATAWTNTRGKGRVAGGYQIALKRALDEKDFDRAQLFQRKLAQLGSDSQMADYLAAVALANDGKTHEAYQRMKQMAPEDSTGFGPAHSWILNQALDNRLGLSDEENQRLIGVHLKHVQSLGAKGPQIELLRALWLAREKRPKEASDVLLPIVDKIPSAAVMRMELDLALGNIEEARSDARAIRVHMNERRRKDSKLSALECRSWAIAEELLGNLDASRDLVRQWLKLEPDNHEARKSLSELSRRKFADVISTPDPDPQELADLFIEAAELTDNQHLLQRQVGFLYRQRDRIPAAKKVVELVAKSPRTHSAILEAAGTAAAEAGNYDQAKTYLQDAVKKDPKNAIAWNNYAFIVSQGGKPDYQEALQAVNKAIEILPEEYHFRETRGQILVHLKKWKEAIPDLEFAVNGMPTSPEIHAALAQAYEAIGEDQLARLHRQQSQ